MNMVESLKGKTDGLLSSAGDINRVLVDKLEQGTRLNLDSANYYSGVGIKQLRALSNIRDFDSVQKFTADSISQSGEIVKKVLDDSKAWMNLFGEAKDQLTGVLKSTTQNAADSAQTAANEMSDIGDSKKKSSTKSALA
jgi:phasin family protein